MILIGNEEESKSKKKRRKLKKKMQNEYRNGLERFYDRYPEYQRLDMLDQDEYLGIGAMTVPPRANVSKLECEKVREVFKI